MKNKKNKFIDFTIIFAIIFGVIYYFNSERINSAATYLVSKVTTSQVTSDTTQNNNIIHSDTIIIEHPKEDVKCDTIKLFKTNSDLYSINTEVNGIKMRFVLDTGCSSDMYISYIEYEFMKRQGLIDGNLEFDSQSILANGDTIENASIIIDKVKIGNIILKDIHCQVSNNNSSTLLLGQNILFRLGNISIDYKKNILIIRHESDE